jgi:hypothetical protein
MTPQMKAAFACLRLFAIPASASFIAFLPNTMARMPQMNPRYGTDRLTMPSTTAAVPVVSS